MGFLHRTAIALRVLVGCVNCDTACELRVRVLLGYHRHPPVWVPDIRSPHATCAYSWISPPSRSRRTTLPAARHVTDARRGAGRSPVVKQHRPDGGRRHRHAQLLELTLDTPVAPARVLPSQPQDHRRPVLGERWTATSTPRLRPLAGHQAPMPPQDRTRRHQEARPELTGKRSAQDRENRTIGGSELGSLDLAAQHTELVAQDGDLDILGVLASQAPKQHADELACREVKKGQGHRPIVAYPDPRCSAHAARFLNPTSWPSSPPMTRSQSSWMTWVSSWKPIAMLVSSDLGKVNGRDQETISYVRSLRFVDDCLAPAGRIAPAGVATSRLLARVAATSSSELVLHLEDDWVICTLNGDWLMRACAVLGEDPAVGQVRLPHRSDSVLRVPHSDQAADPAGAARRLSPQRGGPLPVQPEPPQNHPAHGGRPGPQRGGGAGPVSAAGPGDRPALPGAFRHIGEHDSRRRG
jgi:hypothetical protein